MADRPQRPVGFGEEALQRRLRRPAGTARVLEQPRPGPGRYIPLEEQVQEEVDGVLAGLLAILPGQPGRVRVRNERRVLVLPIEGYAARDGPVLGRGQGPGQILAEE